MGRRISIKCILIFFTFTICCKCQSENPVTSSWAKLEISPDTLSSMEYGNFLIEIYEHAHNHKTTTTASQKKYFFSPLALLDNKSAESSFNNVTKRSEMRFHVEMWSDKVQKEVVKHLNEIVDHEIKSNQVRVIPLEKVILTSNVPTEDYSLSPEWTSYDKSRILRLSLTCFDKKVCGQLANEMRSNPKQFDHLKLLYSLSSQTSQTKQTTISIDSVTSGSMVSKLLQKFKDKKEIFLTANDEKKMLTEMTTNIRMETFVDTEIGSPDTENQILNILKEMLITSRTTIKDQSDKMWDSVFWNEENYRPDKTTKTLNEILNKLDRETQKKLTDMFQKAERQSGIIEKLTSSNKDTEKRGEEQIRRENQSKDAKENENRRSEATEQEQSSRNQTRDEKSKTNKVNRESSIGLGGISASNNFGFENSKTHNTQQENEKRKNEKKNSDTQNRNSENKERMQHNYDANSWTDVDKISSTISEKLSKDSDNSRRIESLKENVEKLLQESKNHVQWDGEKFVPKPMQLSRINLGTFRDSQSFQDRNVRVRYTNAELSAPIKFMEHAELTVTDEWNNLKEQLKEAVMKMEIMNNELTKVKRDLTNKLEDNFNSIKNFNQVTFASTSETLKTNVQNLVKTNAELSNVKRDLTNKLEGTRQELDKTKTELEKMRSGLSKTVDNLSEKINETEKKLTNLSTEFKANIQRVGHEIKIAEGNVNKDLRETSKNLETATRNLASTMTELGSTKSAVADLNKMLNARTREIVDIKQMPTSCSDLQRMGHKLSGFFSVKGSVKMEMIYCDFFPNKNDKQKRIGYVDVKSAPVYFYVQRNSNYNTLGTPIPFDLARVNEGNAMDLTTGIFTAPRPGIYFFSFTGHAEFPKSSSKVHLAVILYLNGGRIGTGYVTESNTVANQNSPLTVQSTLKLKKFDKVWVIIDDWEILGQSLSDNRNHHTHFTGFMLEEDIVVSF
uniref:C1q domain-containing protein n=1 Tax=Daphnia galeata TaxID=27404 RepID=A0A8J2RK93_9CRUS|nr:unnamed protein product [Daphnia galeata]